MMFSSALDFLFWPIISSAITDNASWMCLLPANILFSGAFHAALLTCLLKPRLWEEVCLKTNLQALFISEELSESPQCVPPLSKAGKCSGKFLPTEAILLLLACYFLHICLFCLALSQCRWFWENISICFVFVLPRSPYLLWSGED